MNNGTNIAKGIGSGFVATIVLSVFMLIKQGMGLMPELNPIEMITQTSGAASPAVGWLAHFIWKKNDLDRSIGYAKSDPLLHPLCTRDNENPCRSPSYCDSGTAPLEVRKAGAERQGDRRGMCELHHHRDASRGNSSARIEQSNALS